MILSLVSSVLLMQSALAAPEFDSVNSLMYDELQCGGTPRVNRTFAIGGCFSTTEICSSIGVDPGQCPSSLYHKFDCSDGTPKPITFFDPECLNSAGNADSLGRYKSGCKPMDLNPTEKWAVPNPKSFDFKCVGKPPGTSSTVTATTTSSLPTDYTTTTTHSSVTSKSTETVDSSGISLAGSSLFAIAMNLFGLIAVI